MLFQQQSFSPPPALSPPPSVQLVDQLIDLSVRGLYPASEQSPSCSGLTEESCRCRSSIV